MRVARIALRDMKDYFSVGGQVGIYDAANTTEAVRRFLLGELTALNVQVRRAKRRRVPRRQRGHAHVARRGAGDGPNARPSLWSAPLTTKPSSPRPCARSWRRAQTIAKSPRRTPSRACRHGPASRGRRSCRSVGSRREGRGERGPPARGAPARPAWRTTKNTTKRSATMRWGTSRSSTPASGSRSTMSRASCRCARAAGHGDREGRRAAAPRTNLPCWGGGGARRGERRRCRRA